MVLLNAELAPTRAAAAAAMAMDSSVATAQPKRNCDVWRNKKHEQLMLMEKQKPKDREKGSENIARICRLCIAAVGALPVTTGMTLSTCSSRRCGLVVSKTPVFLQNRFTVEKVGGAA
ncbi:hypothetical protein LSTR_LSTR003128 [Laodelphax striatellus]|uniref:Uncharacterized protein n=1 Tax=Laodelphax striatellus TaxID=195883 RepID=A0A482WVU4_LAOST|nr:hypothetical protein LSTR_LSTR003128 [Laodelphax striatellus]